ncbi:NrtA/SsuA/CpmA family ABC transporter substrate-binding protein [Amycolatopsis sp. VS8301801F10]|uniref:NrtA/SsuA/CpmA family ABC transporter substrate-binding protein n=1 Tax=Amycolatopsis sp. VS8301801F10 TaxID=2652442 RepID=UPI0038FCB8E8
MRIRSLALAAAAVLAFAGVAACSSSAADAGTVKVRIPDDSNSGLLAVGRKDGSLAAALAKVHASVEWTGTAGPFAPAAQQLDANALDFASGSITSATAALAQNPGFKLFSATQPDKLGEGILVKNDSPIKNVRDLAGKKVAVWHGGTSEYLLLQALRQANVPIDSVQRVYLQPGQVAPLFASGQVDAWSTWAQFSVPRLADGGARFLVTGGQVGSENYAVWAVRTGFAEQHPEIVRALYDYLRGAGQRQQQDPGAFLNVKTTTGPEALSPEQKKVAESINKALTPTSPIGAAELDRFHNVARFFAEQHITNGFFDVKPYVIDVNSLPGSPK